MKLLMYFPLFIVGVIKSIIPFNRKTYRPSTELERELSQIARNGVRLAEYRAKRIMFK